MKDYYKILNLPRTCSTQEIRSNYRILVKNWHPDINSSTSARDKTIEIIEAYDVLSNPSRRQVYDELQRNSFATPLDEKQIRLWSAESKTKAHDIIDQGLKAFESGVWATTAGFNLVTTAIGLIIILIIWTASGLYLYDAIALGRELSKDEIFFIVLLNLIFAPIFFINLHWALKGEDSIFRKRR